MPEEQCGPAWTDHLGDRRPEQVAPVTIERVTEAPAGGEKEPAPASWSDAIQHAVLGTAVLAVAVWIRPPVWIAVIFTVLIVAIYHAAWECAREAMRHGKS